jgi:hypothetical protein
MSTKRNRRTNAQIEQLERQIYAVLDEDHPQSVRHVFYRMTDPRLQEAVEKTEAGYGTVQRTILYMRREGRLPHHWIVDNSRHGIYTPTYSGKADFIRQMGTAYRGDLWKTSQSYVEVWVESRSIAGVVQGLCNELAVSLYPAAGFSSETLTYNAAVYLNQEAKGRIVTIFYVGDYDPAGVLIDIAIERQLRAHLDPDTLLEFRRIGITNEQIVEYDLPTKPRKDGDKRSTHVERTVEAEAMPAKILRGILRAEIEPMLPPGAIAATEDADRRAQAWFEDLAMRTAA